MTQAPSTLLGGRYSLVERLAVGGMGEVWRASDTVLGRDVAVKVLRDEYAGDPAFRQRFRAEAQHAALLVHPNVAQVYDFGEGDDEVGSPPYLVMELVRGEPLSARLAGGRVLPPEEVWRVIGQTSAALAAAHAAGIVHRDIKPANLLICDNGTVKVTDFGIARAVGSSSVTMTGQMVGTPQYLSPEQIAGRPATGASDYYALGCVAYECLTGRRPFDGEAMAVLLAHRDSPVEPLPASVPAPLRELVMAWLAKDPDARPVDGAALAAQAARLSAPAPAVAPLGSRAATDRTSPDGDATAAYPLEPAPGTSVLAAPPAVPQRSDGAPPARRLGRRPPGWALAAGAAALCFALAAGLILATAGGSSAPASRHAKAAGAALHPVRVVSVQPYSGGQGSPDHPEEAALAVDGNPSTSWFTQHYATASFGGLRAGSGLVFDLGRAVDVRRLTLTLAVPGTAATVYAGSSPSSLLSARQVGSVSSAGSVWTLRPGATARYWLVWFTKLGPSDGAFRAGIAQATFAT